MKNKFVNIRIQTALGLSAAAALIFEVVATNMLLFYFIESSYSISTILSVFLLGLGIGSLFMYYILSKIKDKILTFGLIQIVIAIYAFLVLTNLKQIISPLEEYGTFFTSFAVLLVPTIFLGMIFPLSASLFKKEKKEIIGLVYSSDLFGAISGCLIAGFILIPNFGGQIAIVFGAGLNLISAFIILSKRQKILPIFLIFLFIISTVNIPSLTTDEPELLVQPYDEYQYYSNSPFGIVKVVNDRLYIDDREQCCRCYSNKTSEKMMVIYALDPLLDLGEMYVLNIGLGCGLTLEKCLEYQTKVDVVEINEKVVEANKVMTDILQNPHVNLIIDDGLHYLRTSKKRYDSILIDIENPTVAHSSNLYTVDAFEIIEDALTDVGTFSLWSYSGNDRYYDIIYYSLKEVFPYIYHYPGVFLASKNPFGYEEYIPTTKFEINTIDRNTLTDAYLNNR